MGSKISRVVSRLENLNIRTKVILVCSFVLILLSLGYLLFGEGRDFDVKEINISEEKDLERGGMKGVYIGDGRTSIKINGVPLTDYSSEEEQINVLLSNGAYKGKSIIYSSSDDNIFVVLIDNEAYKISINEYADVISISKIKSDFSEAEKKYFKSLGVTNFVTSGWYNAYIYGMG